MHKGTILYVGNFVLPDKGASANRVVSNAKLFNQSGYQTVLLGVTKDSTCTGISVLESDSGLLMYERPYPASTKKWLEHMVSVDYLRQMLRLHGDIVLVILYNMPYSAVKAARKFCEKRNIRVSYDCTEWTGVTDGNAVKRFIKKRDERLIREKLPKVTDGLIVISKLMEHRYSQCHNMIKLPPLVDIENSIWHQQPEPHEGFEFCFAGMLDGQKDRLDMIVNAFAQVCDAHTRLRIIGVEADEFKNAYPGAAGALSRCKGNIVFMGIKDHAETVRYMLGCDCYVFIRQPDLRNNAGFPTKFAEAVTCGVPLITTDVSDIAAYQNDSIWLLDAANEDSMTQVMREILNAAPQKTAVRDDFDYRKYTNNAALWLNSVINGGR